MCRGTKASSALAALSVTASTRDHNGGKERFNSGKNSGVKSSMGFGRHNFLAGVFKNVGCMPKRGFESRNPDNTASRIWTGIIGKSCTRKNECKFVGRPNK